MTTAERGVEWIGGAPEAGPPSARPVNLERRGMASEFRPEVFREEAATDASTCPAGKVLAHPSREQGTGLIRPRDPASTRDGRRCPFRCPQTSRGRRWGRTEKPPEVAAFPAKMQTHTARETYRRRGAVAAFSDLGLKARLGRRQFGVRGLRKARCEALGACLTYPWRIRRRGRTPQVQGREAFTPRRRKRSETALPPGRTIELKSLFQAIAVITSLAG